MDLRRYGNRPLRHGVNGGTGRNPRQEDDSLHFLSQEEKECLRFFEDTIGSLEASLEENDLRQMSTSTTPVNPGRAMEEVDGPLTSSPTPRSIMASPLARPLSPKDQDIIDLVRPELDMAQPREPMFNPTNPDFQSLLSTPASHFEIKPKHDSTVSFPSEYSSLMPSGNYGSTDSHYHPPGSVPTPVLIAQKIAESQAGGASSIDPSTLLRRCNQESETKSSLNTDSTLKQGQPPFARPNRFPVSVNMLLGNKDLHHPPQSNVSIQERRGQTNLTGSQPLLQDVSQQNEKTLNKIPRRSISFKDPSPDKSRMEALSKLGLTRNRAMSGGQSLLSPDPSLVPFAHGKTRAEPVVASVSPVSETSVNLPQANVANVTNVANATQVASASNVANVGNSGLVTNVASLANVANVANAPKIINVTNATNVTNTDNVANAPNIINAANVTNMGNVTSVANTPNIANVANMGSVANTPNITSFANSPTIADVGNTASVADPANLATPTSSQISIDRRPEAPQTSPLSGTETRNLQRSPSPPGATQSLAFPSPLEKEAPGYPLPPPPEVSSLEFNSYGGKSLTVNQSCASKSEPATSPVTQEPRILSSALANPSQFNSFGGKSKVVTPVPVVENQSDLPDILSSHLDKSQTLPSKSQLPSAELNSYGGKSRTINPSSGVSRPLSTPGRTLKAPAPAPAPKPSRHSYHGASLPPKTAATALSPERKPRSGSLFRPQSITVQFSGRSGSEELRRDALRKLGLLKDS